jgi:hypothetical protein
VLSVNDTREWPRGLHDDPRADALGEQEGGTRVPEVVDADDREVGVSQNGLEGGVTLRAPNGVPVRLSIPQDERGPRLVYAIIANLTDARVVITSRES